MLPSTQNLTSFVSVAHFKQFKLAASHLNLTESAVSHQISRLEAQLDIQLFERTRKGVMLTDAGRMFYGYVEKALEEIEAGVAAIAQQHETLLAISAPRTFAAMWLAPRISEFSAIHPNIELQITATDRVSDLYREGVDVAIRVSDRKWDEFEQVWLCEQDMTPVTSPELAERIADIGWAQAVLEIPFIRNETHQEEWEYWATETGQVIPEQKQFRKLQSYDLVQAAAARGFGIALSRKPLSEDLMQEGRLVRVLSDAAAQAAPYSILFRKDRRPKAAVKLFVDWIVNAQ
ncbi:LysR family transcriptional regulator [Amylibacter sp. SFDW26]|uniref:LysR substrate-binding domain-containing protein n=1 Tax=Amylibacter sp. SFDW26 TaxID=2652722 RepID=UPI0012615A3B|nr:LysR substrate-binding domain-containing protein [Amylibacter sp. SFDW26]KAB7613933.1 LysR family transcriptional regulator [Amylibacter sp. SFDW26]